MRKEKKGKALKPEGYHTKYWFREHLGVDPSFLDIPCVTKRNPYYRSAPSMRLWAEKDVAPFKNKEHVELFKKRREAGLKAAKSRKTNLTDWFDKMKREHPRVQEIIKRLWQIGEEIRVLHHEKAACREDDFDNESDGYREYEHCDKCSQRSRKQQRLRDERETLFNELEKITGKDKQTIQLARRYIRNEQLAEDHKREVIVDEKQQHLF